MTLFTEEQKDYLHANETSSSRSVACIFGIVLLLEREPRRQINAGLKMANEPRVLIHAIVKMKTLKEPYIEFFFFFNGHLLFFFYYPF